MLEQMGKQAKDAAFILAQLNTTEKNHALSIIAEQLEQQAVEPVNFKYCLIL